MIDSEAHPPLQAGGVSCWSEQIRHRFFPLEPTPVRPANSTQASTCSIMRAAAWRALRPARASIGRDACKTLKHRYVKVIWQLSGVARLEQVPAT